MNSEACAAGIGTTTGATGFTGGVAGALAPGPEASNRLLNSRLISSSLPAGPGDFAAGAGTGWGAFSNGCAISGWFDGAGIA